MPGRGTRGTSDPGDTGTRAGARGLVIIREEERLRDSSSYWSLCSIILFIYSYRQCSVLCCCAFNMSDKYSLKKEDYVSNLTTSISECRKSSDFTDVTLVTNDEKFFTAHKF